MLQDYITITAQEQTQSESAIFVSEMSCLFSQDFSYRVFHAHIHIGNIMSLSNKGI